MLCVHFIVAPHTISRICFYFLCRHSRRQCGFFFVDILFQELHCESVNGSVSRKTATRLFSVAERVPGMYRIFVFRFVQNTHLFLFLFLLQLFTEHWQYFCAGHFSVVKLLSASFYS